jgi:hypothetical protein
MRKHELEKLLHEVELLRGITVEYAYDIGQAIAPHLVVLRGIVNIKGAPHMFEAEINLNEFHSREDVMGLAKAVLASFEKAERNGS